MIFPQLQAQAEQSNEKTGSAYKLLRDAARLPLRHAITLCVVPSSFLIGKKNIPTQLHQNGRKLFLQDYAQNKLQEYDE